MIVLRQGSWTAGIDPLGAELRRLSHAGTELLWHGDPAIWGQTAPLLFPFVGRLRQGGHSVGEQWYPMAIHGFAASQRFTVLERGQQHLRMRLLADAGRFASYPFAFALTVSFKLDSAGLSVTYRVDAGEQGLHFGLGSHPGFALDGPVSDWRVEFDAEELQQAYRLRPATDGAELLSSTPDFLDLQEGRRLALSESLFERDALILKNIRSRCISLIHRERGTHLRLHTGGAPHLGLWSRPSAPYLCIEPWYGMDDDEEAPLALAEKPQLVHLGPSEIFTTGYRITR